MIDNSKKFSKAWDAGFYTDDFDFPYILSCDDPDCKCRQSIEWPDNITSGCPHKKVGEQC